VRASAIEITIESKRDDALLWSTGGRTMRAMVRALWIVLRVGVLGAPFILHLGTQDVVPMLGSTFPDWTLTGVFVASAGALAVAVHDLLAVRAVRPHFSAWIAGAVVSILAMPVVALVLFFVISFLAKIAAVPYTIALAAMVGRLAIHSDRGPVRGLPPDGDV
jgi:hypothetical protein